MRLFSLLQLMVAPPDCKPGKDTSMTFFASPPISVRTATAFDGAFTERHGSGLLTLRLPFVHKSAVSIFGIANVPEGFHGSCRDRVSFPMLALTLSRLSASFIWLIHILLCDRQSRLLVLMRSSNRYLRVTAIRPGSKLSRTT